MPDKKEVTALIGHIRGAGFRVSKSGNQKHWKVMHKTGAAVIDAKGPIIISSSPSEHRWREMTVQRLMAANVLKKDPYKKTATGGEQNGTTPRGQHLASPEMREAAKQARVAAIQRISQDHHERTSKLRARLEPVIARLGGWSRARGPGGNTTGIQVVELTRVAMHWGKTRGISETPEATESAAVQSMRNLMTGGTLGRLWLPFAERFVDDLEDHAGTPPRPEKAAERYMELLREMKGVPVARPPREPTGPMIVRKREPDFAAAQDYIDSQQEPAEPQHVRVGPRHPTKSIAMRAMFLMSKNASSDDMDEIISLGEAIARLEEAP